jgi:hypothetical protein
MVLTETSRYLSRRSGLARTYKDTASCVEAIGKCNPCRKYANNATSSSRRTRHCLPNRYRNQSEPYGSKSFLCSLRQRQHGAIPVIQMTRGQLGAPPMKPAVGRSVARELLPKAAVEAVQRGRTCGTSRTHFALCVAGSLGRTACSGYFCDQTITWDRLLTYTPRY